MTKPSKILWFTFSVAALLLASRASAQTYVTPTVAPTPPGLALYNPATALEGPTSLEVQQ